MNAFQDYKEGKITKGTDVLLEGMTGYKRILEITNVNDEDEYFNFICINDGSVYASTDITQIMTAPSRRVNNTESSNYLLNQLVLKKIEKEVKLPEESLEVNTPECKPKDSSKSEDMFSFLKELLSKEGDKIVSEVINDLDTYKSLNAESKKELIGNAIIKLTKHLKSIY